MEKTVVIIKPDGIQKKLVGEIVKRIENDNLAIADIKIQKLTKEQVSELYRESLRRFPQIKRRILNYMTKEPSIIIIIKGEDAIAKTRKIRGLSDPSKSPVGSVRRDFAGDQDMEELTRNGKVTKNIMHASGSKQEAEFEIRIFFGEKHEI